MALPTVDTTDVSNKIKKHARVRLISSKINLIPVTGSIKSFCLGLVLPSKSVKGGCEAPIVFSEAAGSRYVVSVCMLATR
jgi:hypothetical protein